MTRLEKIHARVASLEGVDPAVHDILAMICEELEMIRDNNYLPQRILEAVRREIQRGAAMRNAQQTS